MDDLAVKDQLPDWLQPIIETSRVDLLPHIKKARDKWLAGFRAEDESWLRPLREKHSDWWLFVFRRFTREDAELHEREGNFDRPADPYELELRLRVASGAEAAAFAAAFQSDAHREWLDGGPSWGEIQQRQARARSRDRAVAAKHRVSTCRRPIRRPRTSSGPPRARTSRRRSSSASRAGPSDPDEPEPPFRRLPPYLRLARALDLSVSQLRWCDRCGIVAFAIDQFQRDQLDALGFVDGLCPICRESEE